jgi:hypothetical protein
MATKKEFNDMESKKVWETIKEEDIPKGRITIKCIWMYKIKRNRIFRDRLVACEHSQVPGCRFQQNDASFRIKLIAKLIWRLEGSIIDVETAFFHGELTEEINMNIP